MSRGGSRGVGGGSGGGGGGGGGATNSTATTTTTSSKRSRYGFSTFTFAPSLASAYTAAFSPATPFQHPPSFSSGSSRLSGGMGGVTMYSPLQPPLLLRHNSSAAVSLVGGYPAAPANQSPPSLPVGKKRRGGKEGGVEEEGREGGAGTGQLVKATRVLMSVPSAHCSSGQATPSCPLGHVQEQRLRLQGLLL